jgi:hypothetical protein
VFGLSSLFLLYLLPKLSPKPSDVESRQRRRVKSRTNLALFFSGLWLGSSADLFNRALCLRGPGSSTTSRFPRFAGWTGLAFATAFGGGGGCLFSNPILFTASVSSNSSSSALFLAIFACLSSSLRSRSGAQMKYMRQQHLAYLTWNGNDLRKYTHYAVGMILCACGRKRMFAVAR